MTRMRLRPFAVLGRCWLHEEVELGPDLSVEPLGIAFSFENELDFVLALTDRLGIKPSEDFPSAARDRLEGTEPVALARFPQLTATDFADGSQQLEPALELVCDALAFLTTN